MRTSVIAVVPLFDPPEGVIANVIAIAEQVDHVYLVNDHPRALRPNIAALASRENISAIDPQRNRGIAAALNEGIHASKLSGATHILTLDQDTRIDRNYVRVLMEYLRTVHDASIVGANAASPGGLQYECIHPVNLEKCSVEVIQSGLLLPTSALDVIGPLREDLHIDGVDTDFMLRMHSLGMHIGLVLQARCEHAIGKPQAVGFFGRYVVLDNHSAMRRYYITRNKVRLLQEYAKSNPCWSRVVRRRLVRQSLIACMFERNRAAKARAIGLGLFDAWLGRSGASRWKF